MSRGTQFNYENTETGMLKLTAEAFNSPSARIGHSFGAMAEPQQIRLRQFSSAPFSNYVQS